MFASDTDKRSQAKYTQEWVVKALNNQTSSGIHVLMGSVSLAFQHQSNRSIYNMKFQKSNQYRWHFRIISSLLYLCENQIVQTV